MKNLKFAVTKYLNFGLIFGLVIVLSSCTKDFDEVNTNKNKLANLQNSQLPFLFAAAEQQGTNSGWNYQVAQNLFADQYAQYFANTTTYFPSDRLVIRMDWIGALWSPLYSSTMPQLQTLLEKYPADSPEHALADIWWVVSFHRVTDTWGPIPYSKAGTIADGIEYDPQDKIYADFFSRLTKAVAVLKSKTSSVPYGSFDLIYGGNVNKWIKFANTLRLRLAMRVSKVDPALAKKEAEAAVADGVMLASPEDDALLQKSTKGDDLNGLSVMNWNEFRMSASMESVLKGYNDPRMPTYFDPTQASIDANAKANGGVYNPNDKAHPLSYDGLRNGLTAAQMANPLNSADANSRHGARWNGSSTDIVFLGKNYKNGWSTPVNVMATAEAYFLRAEGALLGWNMNGTAKDLYEKGIRESMKQWDVSAADAEAYVNSTSTPIPPDDDLKSPALSNVPVKFGTDAAVQKEQIAVQKWLALYPDGVEAWADTRRHNLLKLYPVANSDNPDLPDPTKQRIRRINFMLSEKNTNGAAVTKAIPLLGGGPDKITTPLWWDKN